LSQVAIIDRVTMLERDAAGWVDRLHTDYRPAIESCGATLANSWRRHVDGDTVEICLVWECDIATFWNVRREVRSNPAVDRWWAATDAIALERDRKVYGSL
jgi:hypothetical protein